VIRVGDRVRHRDVIGTSGRVVELVSERALVRWDGYGSSPTWTPVEHLVLIVRS
jgi:hypothetical protein